ncbi:MAG: DUF1929 domain-containing protein [Planctomycetes bacterium]|nr:DUF1929 domain-containing protein [Planctomycetota bacterium]
MSSFAATLAEGALAQGTPATHGQWNGPYANIPPMGALPHHIEPITDGGNAGLLSHEEIAHACLIPPQSTEGELHPYAGKVLVWNRQEFTHGTTPHNVVTYPVTRKVWVIDPTTTPPGVTEIPVPDGAVPTSIFCYGHAFTPEGKLVLAGSDLEATPFSSFLFDPTAPSGTPGIDGAFIAGPTTHRTRFYPTLTLLPSGRIAMFGGRAVSTNGAKWPEIEFFSVTGTTLTLSSFFVPSFVDHLWNHLTPPQTYSFDYYPRMFSINDPANAASDMIFVANDVIGALTPPPKLSSYTYRDSDQKTRVHDANWNPVDPAPSADRRYGSAAILCMVKPQAPQELSERVFTICGSDQLRLTTPGYPALNTVDEFTDLQTGLNAPVLPTPGQLPSQRIWQNATILTDESLFISGGSTHDSEAAAYLYCPPGILCNNPFYYATPQKQAELIYPPNTAANSTGTAILRPAATAALNRLYHSTTILLPDGRVLSIGGSDKQGSESPVLPGTESDPWPGNSVEIYSPPYKFSGIGGRILACPTSAEYGSTFHVDVLVNGTPENLVNANTRVVLMRCGTVTHHHDSDGRLVELEVHPTQSSSLGTNQWRLSVSAPSSQNLGACPKGWYMLFVLTPDSHIPIGSRFIKIR